MEKLKGIAHILTEADQENLKYGKAGDCLSFAIEQINSDLWKGLVLQYPTTNPSLPPLYFKDISQKVIFTIEENVSDWGVSYVYDAYENNVSIIACYIADYRSEIFDGGQWEKAALEKMAIAVLQKAGGLDKALRWIRFDEPPVGINSLSQFLLSVVYPSN